jgi:hypothetical protein
MRLKCMRYPGTFPGESTLIIMTRDGVVSGFCPKSELTEDGLEVELLDRDGTHSLVGLPVYFDSEHNCAVVPNEDLMEAK